MPLHVKSLTLRRIVSPSSRRPFRRANGSNHAKDTTPISCTWGSAPRNYGDSVFRMQVTTRSTTTCSTSRSSPRGARRKPGAGRHRRGCGRGRLAHSGPYPGIGGVDGDDAGGSGDQGDHVRNRRHLVVLRQLRLVGEDHRVDPPAPEGTRHGFDVVGCHHRRGGIGERHLGDHVLSLVLGLGPDRAGAETSRSHDREPLPTQGLPGHGRLFARDDEWVAAPGGVRPFESGLGGREGGGAGPGPPGVRSDGARPCGTRWEGRWAPP